jgi:hypothetical protein
MVSVPAHLKGYMTLHPETPMDVVFGDVAKGLACNIVAIERIYNFVTNDVIPRFARFLQQQV